jgi:catechol 2,3-dioxygenase-like lactoylglutathione lyase family enzyme
MDWTLEVVVLPVSDLGAAIAFYRDRVGFELDHRTTNEHLDVAQLTPRGSGCSIVIGTLPSQNEMPPARCAACSWWWPTPPRRGSSCSTAGSPPAS